MDQRQNRASRHDTGKIEQQTSRKHRQMCVLGERMNTKRQNQRVWVDCSVWEWPRERKQWLNRRLSWILIIVHVYRINSGCSVVFVSQYMYYCVYVCVRVYHYHLYVIQTKLYCKLQKAMITLNNPLSLPVLLIIWFVSNLLVMLNFQGKNEICVSQLFCLVG